MYTPDQSYHAKKLELLIHNLNLKKNTLSYINQLHKRTFTSNLYELMFMNIEVNLVIYIKRF